MHRCFVPLLATVLAACASCRSTSDDSARKHRDVPRENPYVLAILKKGPTADQRTTEERTAIQAAHMANIHRLADEGVLLVAGPFGQPNPDPTRRGVFIFDVAEIARAKELTESDPAVKAGVLAFDLYPLSTRADLHVAQAADRKWIAETKAAGKDPNLDFPMHTYTFAMLRGDKARHAIEALPDSSRVVFVGGLGANSCLAVLDAPDAQQAERALAPAREQLGQLDLTPWWASASLLQLDSDAQ